MVTMKDVAKKANVGMATVSRVLNNSGFVSDETRAIVEKTIEELGYVPNELARNFQKKKANIIAVLVPEIDQHFTVTLVKEIEHYLRDNGYILMLGSSNRNTDIEKDYIDKLKSQSVAGIIITAPLSRSLKKYDFPIVSFDRNLGGDIPFVYTKNYEGGKYLTNLLIKNNCKSLAYVDFGADEESLSLRRMMAFKDTCETENIPYKVFDHQNKELSTREFIESIFDEVVKMDGVVFSCDYFARIFISLCHLHNVKIPEDIQVVSYDAIDRNDNYHPRITRIGHDFSLIAKTLVDLIFKQMNENEFQVDNELDFIIKTGETINSCE